MQIQDTIRPPVAFIEHTTSCVALPLGIVYIGRGVGCFLRINDPSVSRVHLAIEISDQVVVRDLSRNGTLLNGKPLVEDRPLADGDEITLCKGRSLRVRIDEDSAASEFDDETASFRVQVDHHCPRCRADIALEATSCNCCGLSWRSGRPNNPTEPLHGAVRDSDRRTEPRHPVTLSARYRGALEVEGMVQDISAGGLFLASNKCDEPGTRCAIELYPAGMRPATFTGNVVRVLGEELGGTSGMGIKFDPLDGQLTRWLAQYLLMQMQTTNAED